MNTIKFIILSIIITSFLTLCPNPTKGSNSVPKEGVAVAKQKEIHKKQFSLEFLNLWCGKYSFLSEWEGLNGNNEVVVKGSHYITININEEPSNLKMTYSQSIDPPGKILTFDTQNITGTRQKLTFTFKDNWNNEGKGILTYLGNGIYESSLELVKSDPDSPVNHLYSSNRILKLHFQEKQTSKYYNSLAENLYKHKKYCKAAEILKLLDSTLPNDERTQGNYAITLIKLKDLKKAERVLQNLIQNTKKINSKASSYFNLGLLHEQKGDLKTALQYYTLSNYLHPLKQVENKILKFGDISDCIRKEKSQERFKTEDHTPMALWLANSEQVLSPEEIVELFYPAKVETGEGDEKITLSSIWINDFLTEVTLIHDNMLDDSTKGVKYIVQMALIKERWQVVSIKSNCKCWPQRGHTNWDTDYCK